MASQSPVEVPQSPADASGRRYARAWEAIEKLLNEGRSWSGRERKCCYLNCGGKRFADVSAVTGIDFEYDSRGLASVDWDQDGDLDLWVSNRTGPRLTFLRNGFGPGNHFLAVRLIGKTSNRDAIGARVELITRDGSREKSIRTLRAGEGYLSQSSKWIHFGLAGETAIDRLVVRWPGGAAEEFRGLEADRWYEVAEGSGASRPWTPPARSVHLSASPPGEAPVARFTRVVPHARLPLPRLEAIGLDGEASPVRPAPRTALLVALWATWCAPCLSELKELGENREKLRAAGLEVLPLSVDDLDAATAARKARVEPVMAGLKLPWRGALATTRLVERLNAVERTVLSRKTPLPVPSSFLIDPDGRLAAVYRGSPPLSRLLEDAGECIQAKREARDAALPFPGRWYINPFGVDLLAVPRELLEISDSLEALDYLTRHVASDRAGLTRAQAVSAGLTAPALSETYLQVGVRLARDGRGQEAVSAFEKAVGLSPELWAAQVALAEAFQKVGNPSAMLGQYRKMLELRPGDLAVANNLAWMLATRPEGTAEEGQEAVRHAVRLCEATGYKLAGAVDTLAAAYAAAGRFTEAVEAGQKAVELASASGQAELAAKIRGRLLLYQEKRAYREAPAAK